MQGAMTSPDSFSVRPSGASRARCSGLLLGSAVALACGAKAPATPDAASPAPATAVESAGANVGAAALSSAAAPAEPRALPEFCAGVGDAPPPGANAKLNHVKDGFVFVEGPVWSATLGAFFFSEMDFNQQGKNGPPSKIHKLVLPSSVEPFITSSGSNGLAIDDQGLVACTHDTQTLSRFDLTTKARSVFVADYQGKHFNSPNDVALHSAGYTYFTDPDWQIGERPNETGVTGVYLRKPTGEVVLIDGELSKPNGVSLSPDETRLYVGSASGVVQWYPVLADGTVGKREALAEVKEPDGMAVDCAGRLYVASHSAGEVVVLSPEGKALSIIKVAPRATNVAFGGPDRKTLLITAGTGVYSVHSDTPGFPY
jgi:gluconolactonase